MDSLRWFKLNQNVKIVETTKKFYNRYLYKITYNIPGVFLIPYTKDQEHLMLKICDHERGRASSFIYRYKITAEDVPKLMVIQEMYLNRKDIRVRTEGSSISIFSDNIDSLYDLAFSQLAQCVTNLRLVSLPFTDATTDLLEQDYIIVRTPTEYLYKVMLKNHYGGNRADKLALANYLSSIGDEVKVSDKILSYLRAPYKYFYGGYFYVRDPNLVDMIRLVAPTLIRNVQQLKVIQTK